MNNINVVEILKFGLVGIAFLLAFLSFILLNREQKEKEPRQVLLVAINRFMWLSIGFAVIVGAFGVAEKYIEKQEAGDKSRKSESSIQKKGDNLESSCHADIYYHKSGFTLTDAEKVSSILKIHGINSQIFQHVYPDPPDSIFIGSLVSAKDARNVMLSIPYEIKYIFRTDYPESSGGDLSGFRIGIGYISTFLQDQGDVTQRPVAVSKMQLNDLMEFGLSNTEFQKRLRALLSR